MQTVRLYPISARFSAILFTVVFLAGFLTSIIAWYFYVPDTPPKVLAIFLLLSLLFSIAAALVGFALTRGVDKDIHRLETLLEEYRDSHYWPEYISMHSKEMSRLYNLLESFAQSKESDSPALLEPSQETDALSQIHNQLYEKPFAKLNKLEFLLYPKKPGPQAFDFTASRKTENTVHFMIFHLEKSNVSTAVYKIRMRERFETFLEEKRTPAEIREALFRFLQSLKQENPGLVYGTMNDDTGEYEFVAIGSAVLFSLKEGMPEILAGQDIEIPAELPQVVSGKLSVNEMILYISPAIIQAMQMNLLEFRTQILMSIEYQEKPKIILANLLEKMALELQKKDDHYRKLPGMVEIFALKH
ncbi:MAG: hypothetical protein D6767_03200 [Candidatus Hydrogenedentota bacterium]|nr:MAG: hypothetical protein D6767_03200 [Candidatus Hydrogenedentota bacterium]